MFFKGRYVKGKKSGIWVIYIEDGTFNLLLSGKYRNGKAVSKKQHLPPPSIALPMYMLPTHPQWFMHGAP
jgi:hypothetical protein